MKLTSTGKNEIFDAKTTATIVAELQPSLYDMIALGLIIKQAHWNVIGPNFRAVHLELDEVWASVQDYADTIAERISTLAVSPSGQAAEVSEHAELTPIPLGFLKDAEVIDLMNQRVATVCHNISERMGRIEDVDAVTADMFHGVLIGLEKHLWMIRVQTN